MAQLSIRAFALPAICLVAAIAAAACGADSSALPPPKYQAALSAYAAGRQAEALAALEEVLAAEPEFTPALLMQGKLYYYGRNNEAAEKAFAAARESDSENLDAMIWLARLRSASPESRDEALQLIDAAVQRSSSSVEAWYVKGLVHRRRGEVEKAIAAYQAGANEGKRLALIHLQLAELYEQAELADQARAHLALAAALSGGDKTIQHEVSAASR